MWDRRLNTRNLLAAMLFVTAVLARANHSFQHLGVKDIPHNLEVLHPSNHCSIDYLQFYPQEAFQAETVSNFEISFEELVFPFNPLFRAHEVYFLSFARAPPRFS